MASRGGFNKSRFSQRPVTDARQILQLKKARNKPKGNTFTDLSEKLQSRHKFQNRLGLQTGTARTNLGGFKKTGFNQSPISNPGFIRKKNVFQHDIPFNARTRNILPARFNQRNTMIQQPKNKFIKVSGGNITVSKHMPLQNRQLPDDSLELMTLDDLPDLEMPSPVVPRAPSIRSSSTALETRLQGMSKENNATSVLITNLKHSVTEEDIIELFAVVGQLSHAQLLHPGAALVSYASKEEAQTAMDHYNNVTLDGIPMHCSVLSQNQQKYKPSIASRLGERAIVPSTKSSSFLAPQPPQNLFQPRLPTRTHLMGGTIGSNTKFTVCLN